MSKNRINMESILAAIIVIFPWIFGIACRGLLIANVQDPTSHTLGLYRWSSLDVCDSEGIIQPDYSFDANSNILNRKGRVVIASKNVASFTCAGGVFIDNLSHMELEQTRQGDQIVTLPQEKRITFTIMPAELVNNRITITCDNSSVLKLIRENNQAGEVIESSDGLQQSFTVKPDADGHVELTARYIGAGRAVVSVLNLFGESFSDNPIQVTIREFTEGECGNSHS